MQTTPELKSLRIMLIDDDPSIRLAMHYFFKKKTSEFKAFEQAEEALSCLEQADFDVIICDYILPNMSGLEFFEHIRKSHASVMKVLITAYAEVDVVAEALRLGINDFIRKPFNAAIIEKSLLNIMQKRGEQRSEVSVDGKQLSEVKDLQWLESLEFVIAKVAHQINNSLQGLMGNAESGRLDAGQNSTVRDNLDRIIDDLENVKTLNRELRSAGRMISEDARTVDLVELMEQCLGEYAREVKKLGIRVSRNYDTGITLDTKPASILCIFDNVIANSMTAMRKSQNGNPHKEQNELVVSIKKLDNRVRIEVKDNGSGMPKEVLETSFSKGASTSPDRTGLGLFIVERLCKEVGAQCRLTSEENAGTRFCLEIPL